MAEQSKNEREDFSRTPGEQGAALWWMVVDINQGKGDGWYRYREVGQVQLAFWRREHPTHRFELVGCPGPECRALPKLADDEWLGRYLSEGGRAC